MRDLVGASVCWKSAWTLATRTRGRPERHAARAATRAALSSRISSRPLVRERGSRLERDDRLRLAQPRGQLLGDAIGDLRVARDPDEPLAARKREGRGEERLGAVRHRRVRDVAQVLADAALAHRPEALDERGHLAGLGEQARQRRQVRQRETWRRRRRPLPSRRLRGASWSCSTSAAIRRSRVRRPRTRTCRLSHDAAASASRSSCGRCSDRRDRLSVRSSLRRERRLRSAGRLMYPGQPVHRPPRRSTCSLPAPRRGAPSPRPRRRPRRGRRRASCCSLAVKRLRT